MSRKLLARETYVSVDELSGEINVPGSHDDAGLFVCARTHKARVLKQKSRVGANGTRTRDLPPITCYGHRRAR